MFPSTRKNKQTNLLAKYKKKLEFDTENQVLFTFYSILVQSTRISSEDIEQSYQGTFPEYKYTNLFISYYVCLVKLSSAFDLVFQ